MAYSPKDFNIETKNTLAKEYAKKKLGILDDPIDALADVKPEIKAPPVVPQPSPFRLESRPELQEIDTPQGKRVVDVGYKQQPLPEPKLFDTKVADEAVANEITRKELEKVNPNAQPPTAWEKFKYKAPIIKDPEGGGELDVGYVMDAGENLRNASKTAGAAVYKNIASLARTAQGIGNKIEDAAIGVSKISPPNVKVGSETSIGERPKTELEQVADRSDYISSEIKKDNALWEATHPKEAKVAEFGTDLLTGLVTVQGASKLAGGFTKGLALLNAAEKASQPNATFQDVKEAAATGALAGQALKVAGPTRVMQGVAMGAPVALEKYAEGKDFISAVTDPDTLTNAGVGFLMGRGMIPETVKAPIRTAKQFEYARRKAVLGGEPVGGEQLLSDPTVGEIVKGYGGMIKNSIKDIFKTEPKKTPTKYAMPEVTPQISAPAKGSVTEPPQKSTSEVLYHKIGNNNIEIIKNPSPSDYRQIDIEFKKEFPNAKQEPSTRTTYDSDGNKYIWRSDRAAHSDVEPFIINKFGVEANQNKYFSQPPKKSVGAAGQDNISDAIPLRQLPQEPLKVKTEAGEKVTITPKPGEAFSVTPFQTAEGKIKYELHDGDSYIIPKNTAQDLTNRFGMKPLDISLPKDLEVVRRGESIKPQLPKGYSVQKLDIGYVVVNPDGKGVSSRMASPELAIHDFLHETGTTAKTKYSQYTLPEGKNYREVLLKAPNNGKTLQPLNGYEKQELEKIATIGEQFRTSSQQTRYVELGEREASNWNALQDTNTFKSSHWDEPNVVAHTRLAEHTATEARPEYLLNVGDTTIGKYKTEREAYAAWQDNRSKGAVIIPPNKPMGAGHQTTLLEEIQSDWAREGREKGFKTDMPRYTAKRADNGVWDIYNEQGQAIAYAPKTAKNEAEAISIYHETQQQRAGTVPSHPSLKDWQTHTLKHAIKEAVDAGSDSLSWVTGEQTADRYDLSKQISRVTYNDATKQLVAYDKAYGQVMNKSVEPNEIANYVGKDASEKLLKQKPDKLFTVDRWAVGVEPNKWAVVDREGRARVSNLSEKEAIQRANIFNSDREVAGVDLRVGGEWASNLYDKQIPNILKDLTKGYNTKFQDITLENGKTVHSMTITPELREAITGDKGTVGAMSKGAKADKLSLEEEAKKYKSAEEFADSLINAKRGNVYQNLNSISRNIPIENFGEFGKESKAIYQANQSTNPEGVNRWIKRIENGERPPVIAGSRGFGFNSIIDGHHRVEAYRQLGFKEIPTISRSDLTDIWNKAHEDQPTFKEGDVGIGENITGSEAAEEYLKIAKRLKLSNAEIALVKTIASENGPMLAVSVGKGAAFTDVVSQFAGQHEMVHTIYKNLKDFKLFKDKGITQKGLDKEITAKYGPQKDNVQIQERLATGFEEYVKERLADKETSAKGRVKIFFDKIWNWLKNLVRPVNRPMIDEFYDLVQTGKAKVATELKGKPIESFISPDRTMDFKAKKGQTFLKPTVATTEEPIPQVRPEPEPKTPSKEEELPQRGFAETVETTEPDPNLKRELEDMVYPVQHHEVTIAAGDQILKDNIAEAHRMVNSKDTGPVEQYVGMKLAHAERNRVREYLAIGDEVNAAKHADEFINLINKVSSKATVAGQANEILKLWSEADPITFVRLALNNKLQAKKGRVNQTIEQLKNRDGLMGVQRAEVDYLEMAKKRHGIVLSPKETTKILEMADKITNAKTEEEKILATHETMAYINQITPATWMDKILEARAALFLTGLKTHIVNITGQGVQMGLQLASTPISASIELAKEMGSRAMGHKYRKERFFGETTRLMKGYIDSFPTAARMAIKGFQASWEGMPLESSKIDIMKAPAIKGTKGKVIRIPFHALSGADAGFTTMNKFAWTSALAYRQAMYEKSNGKLKESIDERADYLMKNPSEFLDKLSSEMAMEIVYKQPLGPAAKKVGEIREQKDILGYAAKWNIPFFQTPINVPKTMVEYSPFAVLSPKFWKRIKEGGGESSDAMSRAILGSVIMAGITALALQDDKDGIPRITGGPPRDKTERTIQQTLGIPYYSFRLDIKGKRCWVSWQRTPFALLFNGAAEIARAYREWNDKTLSELLWTSAVNSGKMIVDQPFLTGINDTLNAILDPDRYGETYLQRQAGSMTPAIVRQTERAMDLETREPKGYKNAILSGIPWAAETLKPKRDLWGEVVKRRPLWGEEFTATSRTADVANVIINPFTIQKGKERDPASMELYRLRVVPTMPTDKIAGLKLNETNFDKYQMYTGKEAKEVIDKLIDTGSYRNSTPEEKRSLLKKAYNKVKATVAKDFFNRQITLDLEKLQDAPPLEKHQYLQSLIDNGTIKMETLPNGELMAEFEGKERGRLVKSRPLYRNVVNTLGIEDFTPQPKIRSREPEGFYDPEIEITEQGDTE